MTSIAVAAVSGLLLIGLTMAYLVWAMVGRILPRAAPSRLVERAAPPVASGDGGRLPARLRDEQP